MPIATDQPASDAPGPLLRISDLAVSFRGHPSLRAVDGVSLSVHAGQTLAVVGESGCGKSVTALSVLRLIPNPPGQIERGRILLAPPPDTTAAPEPRDLLKLDERHIRSVRGNQISMIFQEPMTSLNPVFTIGEQIEEAVLLHQGVDRRRARDAAARALTEVGIADAARRLRAYPHEFSGGMRQRVMIAMALACEPRLLLADEPTTALDVTVQAQVLALLRSLQERRGMAIMLITHALGVVAQNADVVCVMYGGRIVEYATVFDLFDRPLHPYTRGLLSSIPKMGDRQDRLVTVRQTMDNPAEFEKLGPGLTPWWPAHEPPRDVERRPEPPVDYVLSQVETGHWVGLWRTTAALARPAPEPDLAFRRHARPSSKEAACAS